MDEIALYAAPGTCARVPMILLEELGVPYELRVVRFMKGEHKSADYKAVNPKGKVPALVINGEPLTENVAIIQFLNERFPDAKLLPPAEDALTRARQTADLCFCSATLHPIVTRIRIPFLFAPPAVAREIWRRGCDAMTEFFSLIDQRLSEGAWWYGESWSAMDAYLYWVFWRAEGAEFDVTPYPGFARHQGEMNERASVKAAANKELEMEAHLEADGLKFTPPPLPQ